MFFHTCLQIQKKAKIDDLQALNMLNKKLNNEFQDCLLTIQKAKNLNDLIIFLQHIDANIKKIDKKSHLCTKLVTSVTSIIKSLLKTMNSTFVKLFIFVGIIVIASGPSIGTRIYLDPMNICIASWTRPILQPKKDRQNNLSLYRYCDNVDCIAIEYKNPILLVSKK